jgi:hypothetical protein
MSADAERIDPASITNALSRHTSSLKARQMAAVVKAESEVLKISGNIPVDADAAAQAAGVGSSADTSQLLAAVNAAIAESEQRMRSFMREEIRRAVITITKLEVPRDAPPPPQFLAHTGQFRCGAGRLLRDVSVVGCMSLLLLAFVKRFGCGRTRFLKFM